MAELTAAEVARIAEGDLEGDGTLTLHGVAPLEEAGPGHLSFVAEARYHPYIHASRAGAVLVARDARVQLPAGMSAVRVDDPRRALARLLPLFYPETPAAPGVHATAVLGDGVVVASTATVGPYAVVGEGTRVGERARIGAQTVVGRGCEIGDDVVLHPHVTLYDGVRLGERCIVHSGARLGADGFGYVPDAAGLRKMPQVGRCILEADVEVGANTTIDRGSIGDTVVGRGTKIDNLVMIGHNCRIGRNVIIVSQVGISGSTRVGDGAVLGGQAGVQGHIEIGAGARVGGQAGVLGNVEAGATVSGYPARPHREALRVQAAVFALPKLVQRLRALETIVLGRGAKGAPAASGQTDGP
ncbi:UDP-3-O-(3-hydroxymyristoyl)glucosamine N-acyltransferase [Longimicrobium terrae]|uniref:UDP-3-O-acylglucosamine N-acyltransferase n=1 Tax=Longimicrobium terrae TaxID=1639882 RepID=A0A841H4D6_9BACT|nr:UDP-3-O-(3-hydroxymyristoyl)glucosamine N-acyltransferase [Longimicrobium terrae]MBB4638630.1 UDP-3-O-[3-hydroxymyristoyl] glucosamine N-acyltransferase [Longimicrobium terrae]MBB6072870.1 UDP-3-O-[3-hydroxymyristoyl] glucosamine N-acyltransferase [Longimicrobium terrae]NNC31485.1 UDP-3-O-(3-hydroxymyristoyl)glucosamine N-acyltransferase [Longimicrobium terrae]